MNGRQRMGLGLALAAGLVVTGCGGGKSSGGHQAKGQPGAVLARYVYPRCGTAGFQKPRIAQVPGPGGSGPAWQLGYHRTTEGLRRLLPGDSSSLLVIEESPKLPRGKIQGGHDVTIAGHSVSLREPLGKQKFFFAQWKTSAARYIVAADGTRRTTLDRFIACLP